MARITLIDSPCESSIKHRISRREDNPTFGLKVEIYKDTKRPFFESATAAVLSIPLPRWCTEVKDAILISISGTYVDN